MSELDLETLTADPSRHLAPETLKQRIRTLVRCYARRRSARIARAVARYSGALALHPALRDQPEQLSAFCRLNWHWRLLAAQCPRTASA